MVILGSLFHLTSMIPFTPVAHLDGGASRLRSSFERRTLPSWQSEYLKWLPLVAFSFPFGQRLQWDASDGPLRIRPRAQTLNLLQGVNGSATQWRVSEWRRRPAAAARPGEGRGVQRPHGAMVTSGVERRRQHNFSTTVTDMHSKHTYRMSLRRSTRTPPGGLDPQSRLTGNLRAVASAAAMLNIQGVHKKYPAWFFGSFSVIDWNFSAKFYQHI